MPREKQGQSRKESDKNMQSKQSTKSGSKQRKSGNRNKK
jgi:hypothetical protein